MLQLENLSIAYDSLKLFENVNLQVNPGEVCCIEVGVLDGSTSLLKCMAGIIEPTAGTCMLSGTDLQEYPDAVLLQKVCYCYEDGGLVSLFNVYENIVLPLVYHDNVSPVSLQPRVVEIARKLFIEECLFKQVHELNDVQTRLVNLARAMLLGAELVLLDEMQEGMSPGLRDAVLDYLLDLREREGLTIIMTTTAGDETGFADRVFSIAEHNLQEQH